MREPTLFTQHPASLQAGARAAVPRPAPRAETQGGQHTALAPRPTIRAAAVLRNIVCGLAAAGGTGFAETLLLPPVIVAAFVAFVGGGYGLVALVPVISAVAWGLASAVTGHVVANRSHAVPLAAVALLLWAICTGFVAAFAGARLGGAAAGLLAAFFAAYTLAAIARGFALVAAEQLPERVAPDAARGVFVRVGGIATLGGGILAAFVAAHILAGGATGAGRASTATNMLAPFLTLFSFAALALCAAAGCTLALAEQAQRLPRTPRMSFLGLRAAPELLRLPGYACYLTYRVVASFAAVAEPFVVAYAVRDLRIAPEMIGAALVAFVVARAVMLAAGRLFLPASGGRLALQLATLCRLLAAAIMVALPVLHTTMPLDQWLGADTAQLGAILIAVACLGAARGATAIGAGYLRGFLPPAAYPAAVACTNGVLAVTSLALLAGGVLAERSGIAAVFLAALALGAATLLIGGFLPAHRTKGFTTETPRTRRKKGV